MKNKNVKTIRFKKLISPNPFPSLYILCITLHCAVRFRYLGHHVIAERNDEIGKSHTNVKNAHISTNLTFRVSFRYEKEQ